MIWKDVNLWRKQRRNELLARRMKRLLAERKQARDTVVRFLLSDVLIGREAGCIGSIGRSGERWTCVNWSAG